MPLLKQTSLKQWLVLVLLVSLSRNCNAQVPLDTLLQRINYQKEDTIKAKLYYDIAKSYFSRNRAMFKTYTDSMLRLSKKLKYSNGIGLSYAAYSYYYSYDNNWEKVKFYLHKSDSVYEKLGKTSNIMSNKELYSLYYKYVGEYNKALQNDLTLLRYYERNGPRTSEAKLLGAIALLLTQLERYKEAEPYYKKSIALRRELKDYYGESKALLNYGAMLTERDEFRRAEPYIMESIRLQKYIDDETNIPISNANLVCIYAETGRAKQAIELAKECEIAFKSQQDTTNMVKVAMYVSVAYTKLKQYNKAIQALDAKYHLIKNQKPYQELEADLLWKYYKIYKAMGKTDVALEYLEEAKSLDDQTHKLHIQHGVSQAKEYYETAKKQKENLQLRRDNELKDLQIRERNYFIYGSILLLILMIIIAFTTIRYNRLKNEKVAVEMEQRLLQTQMNPHFIFNVLHAIHTYMLKKDTEESGKLLTSFARLVRSILQHSSTDNIPLAEELKWLKDYIGLQQLRFPNAFNYSIEIDEAISPDNLLLPPMLIQPFIENAIEHGFSGLDKAGALTVSYKKIGAEVEIMIRDNGKGFSQDNQPGQITDQSAKTKKEHESAAILITEKRVRLLNQRRRGAFKFQVRSKPNEGTTIYFSIPYKTLF